MSPENQWLEDVFPTEISPFFRDMLVFVGVSTISKIQKTNQFMGKFKILMVTSCQSGISMH